MNYDQPRELADKSGWHYTSMNDGQVRPIGYCRDHAPKSHLTEDGARQCYTRYLLDRELGLDGERADAWYRCKAKGCDALTNRYAQVGRGVGSTYDLCDQHRTRDVVAVLFGMVGDSIHS